MTDVLLIRNIKLINLLEVDRLRSYLIKYFAGYQINTCFTLHHGTDSACEFKDTEAREKERKKERERESITV